VTARALAERFEVSVRTIQRDMEALAMGGLPVTAAQGQAGGYGFMKEYTLDRQWLDDGDFAAVLASLEGMNTAFGDDALLPALEKLRALVPPSRARDIHRHQEAVYVDFQASRQDGLLDPVWTLLVQAVKARRPVRFVYTNSRHDTRLKTVEPLLVTYRWHAWYLFAFCREKRDYHLFRLTRIGEPALVDEEFRDQHGNSLGLLREHDLRDRREYVALRLKCEAGIRVQMAEWFPHAAFLELGDGTFEVRLELPASESHWRGVLLSCAGRAEVLEPASVREWMAEQARRILAVYRRDR
jgi:predicted DNA-binding transcriptional regulator YafY